MRIGVDLGGTAIKIGVVEGARLVEKLILPTPARVDEILDAIEAECASFMARYPVRSIGMGAPGTLMADRRGVVCAANLPFENTLIVPVLEDRLGVPVFLENDATCAALGECQAGLEFGVQNAVLLTIGTGVGGGVIVHRQVYRGRRRMAGEFGHVSLQMDGPSCACGGRGCLERYASVTALIAQTREAGEKAPDSLLARIIREAGGLVDGRTPFLAARQGCAVAAGVLERYRGFLQQGIQNLVWMLDPDVVILSGAISLEEEDLVAPLRQNLADVVPVRASVLQGDAGILGAVCLLEEEQKNLVG